MWDEEWTEVCRQKFINRMYKFPTNPTFNLNTGAKMPVLGFGTWRNQQVSNVTQRALRRGLRSVALKTPSYDKSTLSANGWAFPLQRRS